MVLVAIAGHSGLQEREREREREYYYYYYPWDWLDNIAIHKTTNNK
jgi:hypothetical protein